MPAIVWDDSLKTGIMKQGKEQMEAAHKDKMDKISAILTPEQKKKWEGMMEGKGKGKMCDDCGKDCGGECEHHKEHKKK